MSEPNTKKKNTKKIVIIVVAALLILAAIAAAVVLILRNSGNVGPKDPDGNPIYPKAADVTSVEYLHRAGLESKESLMIVEKELTKPEDIEDFLDQLKAEPLTDPTDKDRADIDYTGDVEMFTLKRKDGTDVVLLIMGKSISINNEYGSYFYMTDGLDLEDLTFNFEKMDLSSKIGPADTTTK